MKIYLSPSNQDGNIYAFGNTNEMAVCSKISVSAEKYLTAAGFNVRRAASGQNMYVTIADSNSWCADLHICIHTNAGGGKGCEVYTYSGASARNKWAEPIYKALSAITPGGGRGMKTANFAELRDTKCPAVYCECEFHDTPELAQWIIGHTDQLGKAICAGVCGAQSTNTNTFKPYLVRIKINDLNIRTGPGTNFTKTGQFTGTGIFTIVDEKSGSGASLWGKLKSGAGWISMDYTTRLN